MKKYNVLEAHQGDKFYKPGDPETGTRIADPNAVEHLVKLGLLEEIGDADVPTPPADDAATIADLRVQIETLVGDREAIRDAVASDIGGLRAQIGTLTQERDVAGAEAATTIADLQGQVGTLTEGLEKMRGDIASLSSQVAGRVATEAGGTDAEGQDAPVAARRSRGGN